MRIGFITLGSKVPSTRFRFLPYLPHLQQRGHSCQVWMSYPSVYESIPWLGWRLSTQLKRSVRRTQLAHAAWLRPDCIYLERGCFNDDSLGFDRAFRKCTKRLVLDVDDGIFLEFPDKVDALIQMSDHVVASNEPIAAYLQGRHDHITVIPTAVPLARFRPKDYEKQPVGKPVIGWIGSLPNMPFLSVCAEALRELASRYAYELLIVAPSEEPLEKIDLRGIDLRFETWNAASEIEHLHRMDIGLMPLPAGEEWMRYKAATKLVQYLSVGIPAVASPIGVNEAILAGNRVGYAARNTDEWISALERLLTDRPQRIAMGRAGRELVTQRYSIEANAPLLEKVLCGAVDQS